LCGIAGLIYYNSARTQNLGADLLALIQPLETRGPDSCGIALYSNPVAPTQIKVVVHTGVDGRGREIQRWIEQRVTVSEAETVGDSQRLTLECLNGQAFDRKAFKQDLQAQFPDVQVMSAGQALEIYKEVGGIENLIQKYRLNHFSGSHGIAHTRMATESVVDTNHCHPFTTSDDLSIVHNGQISNYYKVRFQLERAGAVFETHNDSEAIAHYINYYLLQGKSLETALQYLLDDLDGTYTFLVATRDKLALVRDKFAAKPAVIYESSEMVAIASEYRALLNLPNFNPSATIREPDAGEVNVWSVVTAPQKEKVNV
jgi:amidophosphoribosyltransferase